jgi:tetratricopeptide (TPR) repeat protein
MLSDYLFHKSVAMLFVMLLAVTYASAQPSESEVETDSECLVRYKNQAEYFKTKAQFLDEIDVLIEASTACEDGDKILTDITLKYLELGDNTYNEKERGNKKFRKQYFETGVEWAEKAIEANEDNHLAYEMKSTAFAALVSVSGLKDQAYLADSVRIYAEKALELNPENDRAIHILGRWHYEVAQISGFTKMMGRIFLGHAPEGSMETAIEYFQKAASIDDYPIHRYWLGMGYLKNGEKEKALKEFRYLQNLPDEFKNDEHFKKEARKELKKHS